MITRTFKLCLNAGTGSAPYINVSQYDEGETWLFELYSETGERYIPTTGAIVGVKSDGHGIVNTGTVDSEGRVVITETQQMTASAGRAIFELSIDGLTHGTANFIVAVERKPTDDAVMSDSDLSLIQEAVDAAETIEDLIDGHDPDEVIADAVDAWLDAHPEATTTVEDGAITSAKLNDSVKTGVFEDMTVGTSLAVMNDEGTTDNLAYKFRQTGGDAVRELDEIHGGTIAWNQMVQELNATNWATESGVTATYADGVATVSSTTEGNGIFQRISIPVSSGHKYLTMFDIKGTDGLIVRIAVSSTRIVKDHTVTNSWETYSVINANNSTVNNRLYVFGMSSTYENMQVRNGMLFDLTQMFGSTVADAIYAMEQSSAGSGVAYFRSLFPNSYYAYNSGELVSVEGLSSHETVGFNQWDEEWELGAYSVVNGAKISRDGAIRCKNMIPVLPNTKYYKKSPSPGFLWNIYYDKNQNYLSYVNSAYNAEFTTPSNAYYMVSYTEYGYGTTYNHDICINISSSENGTYKPYQKHTYPLDSTLTLRGVPKWSNGLYFDGDIYRHDGSVSRRYGIVTLDGTQQLLASNFVSGGYVQYDTRSFASGQGKAFGNGFSNAYMFSQGSASGEYVSLYNENFTRLLIRDSRFGGTITTANQWNAQLASKPVIVVYELATPTAETADPYQQYQICDGKGTEEYISTSVTPVGHSTFYPVDIVAKVNKLPSDFSTLIAPTEATFKATRNYTAKQFLIINNQLYRVTANIANGANIVPNTNVTAVTIADILTTLI